MPRQIIDTESSRPAYTRRRTRRFVVSLLLFVVLVAAIWFLAHRARAQETRAAGGTASQCLLEEREVPVRPLGFLGLITTAAIVACSSLGQTSGVNVGPNFPSKTLYATNSNQNAISIYTNGTKTGGGPAYEIGGSNTSLDGPQYLAFDRAQDLWVTNYNPSTNRALAYRVRGAGDRQRRAAGHERSAGAAARHRLYAEGADPLALELGKPDPTNHGDCG